MKRKLIFFAIGNHSLAKRTEPNCFDLCRKIFRMYIKKRIILPCKGKICSIFICFRTAHTEVRYSWKRPENITDEFLIEIKSKNIIAYVNNILIAQQCFQKKSG